MLTTETKIMSDVHRERRKGYKNYYQKKVCSIN